MDRNRTTRLQLLATACLAHLQREEQLLISLQEVADQMRGSLTSREYFVVETLSNSSLTDDLEAVSESRAQLRAQISEFFEVPKEAATLRLLLEHAGLSPGNALEEMQMRLSDAAEDLNRTLVATGNLARYRHELIESVFRSLGAEAATSSVYERSGRHRV